MKYTALLLALTATLLLCACDKDETASLSEMTSTTASEILTTTADTQIAENEATQTTSALDEPPIEEILRGITKSDTKLFVLSDGFIYVVCDDVLVQYIECGMLPEDAQVYIGDYNFDGYDDISVPCLGNGEHFYFYLWDEETAQYLLSSTLTALSAPTFDSVNKVVSLRDSTLYYWNGSDFALRNSQPYAPSGYTADSTEASVIDIGEGTAPPEMTTTVTTTFNSAAEADAAIALMGRVRSAMLADPEYAAYKGKVSFGYGGIISRSGIDYHSFYVSSTTGRSASVYLRVGNIYDALAVADDGTTLRLYLSDY